MVTPACVCCPHPQTPVTARDLTGAGGAASVRSLVRTLVCGPPPPGMFMDHLKCHRCLTDLVENGVSYQAGIAHDPVYSTS